MPRAPEAEGAPLVRRAALLMALTALLPFLRGLLTGQSLFFRDLSLYFFPLRRFVVEGLLRGEVRFWNPLVHEGKQELFPALGYPFDLLQVLMPDERGFTLLLVAHVPLAALSFFALARGVGLSALAAAGGGLVYALGGFGLSLVNLYDYIQAAAWAPLFALGLLRIPPRRTGATAFAAAAFAILVSSGRVEIVIQAVAVALVLSSAQPSFGWRWSGRIAVAFFLGAGLSAPVWTVMAGVIRESGRASGLDTRTVLAHSIHPLTFGQMLVANLHGDLANPVGRWWGDPFFSGGFPYFLSFYVGATVMALAILGSMRPTPWRTGLLCLAAAATWISLGTWGGWTPLIDNAPFLRRLRFPSKAFYTLHTAVALFAAVGLDRLARSPVDRRVWGRFAALALAWGGLLVLLVPLTSASGGLPRWFFPPTYLDGAREAVSRLIASDAAVGGLVALAAAGTALLVGRERLGAVPAATLVVLLVAADLLRSGTGLNPMVTRAFFALSPEMRKVVDGLNARGARVYTCHVPSSETYLRSVPPQAEDRDVRMFTLLRETLTPSLNLPNGPPTAYSADLTRLVPVTRTLDPKLARCSAVPAILDRLRAAGVSHVVSLDPLDAPDLTLESLVRPRAIEPLTVHVYALARPLPLRALAAQVERAGEAQAAASRAAEPGFQQAGGVVVEATDSSPPGSHGTVRSLREAADLLRFEVESDGPGVLVVRDAFAPGWQATVDGRAAPVWRADGRHRATPVPSGHSFVTMAYRPPGIHAALVLWLVGFLGTAASVVSDRRSALRDARAGPT